MNDINFFSTFAKEKEQLHRKTKKTRNIVWGVILVIVLFFSVMGIRMFYMYWSIQNSEKFLNSPDVKTRLEQINAKKVANQSMVTYNNELTKAGKKIELTDRVSTELLDKIQNAMPATASLKNLKLEGSQLILQGNAPNWMTVAELTHNLEAASWTADELTRKLEAIGRTTAAEFSHNLEAAGLFNRVHVKDVTKKQDAYTYDFSLLCELKEVADQ